MQNPIRIGCAVPHVAVADTEKNAQEICLYISRAAGACCHVVVFPELALTGATCGDLFYQQLLLTGTQQGLEKIRKCSAAYPALMVVAGLPVMEDGVLYSAAAVLRSGKILGTAVADRYRSVCVKQQHCLRLSDNIRASDDDAFLTGNLNAASF